MSADFWLGLQQDWDLWHALRSEAADEISRLEPIDRAGQAPQWRLSRAIVTLQQTGWL
jgi:plasmid maintenance system antidote protein VapI